jgi:FAD/FMN-containing dehydrogenase
LHHFIQEGASNIGPSGFTIDMQKMNQITLAANKSIVALGPGSNWGDVYGKLDPLGVTVLGGRTAGVGVGGLLLGGNYFQYIACNAVNSLRQGVYLSFLLNMDSPATTC